MLNWLLIFGPIAAGPHFLRPDQHTMIVIGASTATIPLAGWLGHATEHLATGATGGQ